MTAEPATHDSAHTDNTDAETTSLIKKVEAPLPPYAQAPGSGQPVAHPPMSPYAPPPPSAYRPGAPIDNEPDATTGRHEQSGLERSAETPTVADAMFEISMPPLASSTELAPVHSQVIEPPAPVVVDSPAPVLGPVVAATAVIMPPPATEVITCPECGTVAHVTLNRRESMDFCKNCDYPLFWTPSKIFRDSSDVNAESLRRLPGQAGRATVASLPCPFCYEPNALSAETCIRCGRSMHPIEEPPPPAPVYVAPAPAPVAPPPQPKVAWWVWALLALGAAALIVLVVLIATGTIG